MILSDAQTSRLFQLILIVQRFGHGRYHLWSFQLLQLQVDTADTAVAGGLVGTGNARCQWSTDTTTIGKTCNVRILRRGSSWCHGKAETCF
jgi:hypothetical protein